MSAALLSLQMQTVLASAEHAEDCVCVFSLQTVQGRQLAPLGAA
jgi:hypothetical protein